MEILNQLVYLHALHVVESMAIPGVSHPLVTKTENLPVVHPGEESSQVSLSSIFAGTAHPGVYIIIAAFAVFLAFNAMVVIVIIFMSYRSEEMRENFD